MSHLTVNEWLTLALAFVSLLVALGSLAVSYLTYRTASDTTDIKAAIGNLSELASQTKRQADAMHDQLGAVRDQVDALKQQAEEAKHQTAAIGQQTEAIRASSEAAVRSADASTAAANAQRFLADTTARSQQPKADLMEVAVSGFDSDPKEDGQVHFGLFWSFRNVGGSALAVVQVKFGLLIGAALPETMPEGTLVAGSGVVVVNTLGSAFALKDPFEMNVPAVDRDAVLRHEKKLLFFAKIDYLDSEKKEHSRCFGREFLRTDKNVMFAVPSGGAAYMCDS